MSNLQQIFPFNNALVRRFLNWKQGDEEDNWRNKAVDMLIKKLRRQSDNEYANLQIVLQRKTEDTPCITLSRSQDGRLQVSHRKMLPHVMYCRIFRWPDLQSQHELKSVPNCAFPAGRREGSKICVNPYHYTRVDHSIYPPVVAPRNSEFAEASPSPQSPMSPGSNYSIASPGSQTNYFSPNLGVNNPNGSSSAFQLTPVPQNARHQSFQASPFRHENDPHSYLNTTPAHLQQPTQPGQLMGGNYYAHGQSPLSESNWFMSSNNMSVPNGDGMINLAESPSPVAPFESQSSPPPGYTSRDQQSMNGILPVDSDEGREPWCQISYAELNQKVGELFKGSSARVIVDGYTDPSVHGRRFSLGVLPNVNRNSTIEMIRSAIGKGVCLESDDTHRQIYVKNLSEASIFFHSKNHNVENQLGQHAVVKISPQVRHKIFDQDVFENSVQEALRSKDDKTYERLCSLTEHCIIKMSFVKGWGSTYQRQDITSTPCWIEIHLLKPYSLIAQYQRQLPTPSSQITSTS